MQHNEFMNNSFGSICREWRKQRRYSQLHLALELDISSKHISFIETGRSIPSREMILKIGAYLFIPKGEINRGLYSAGYAPVYTDLPYEHEDLKHVVSAIDQMLINHMPYPAIVLNQYWDVVKANESAQKLLAGLGFSGQKNLIEAIIDDDPEKSKIIGSSLLHMGNGLKYSPNIYSWQRALKSCRKKNYLQPHWGYNYPGVFQISIFHQKIKGWI
jgi:transcriptional regulator with XRE-family HTH domain